MSDLIPSVSLVDGRPATTSLKIAECFGKHHKNVIRDIELLIGQCPEDFHKLNFELMSRKVKIGNGAEREEPYYTVYFDGFVLLVMGYTGKKALAMKLAYIGAFNAMKERLEAGEKPQQANGSDTPIGPADQNILQTIVKTKALALVDASHKGGFPQIWSRFNDHFRLGSYKQLPQSKMAEAVEYLVKLEVREKKELPQPPKFPSAIKTNYPGPQPGDKYYAYLEKVERWRVATVAERKNLYNEGIALLELERIGREMFHVCADYLSLWLKTEVLTSPTSVFDDLLRHNRAPVMLAKFLNDNFEDVRKYLK